MVAVDALVYKHTVCCELVGVSVIFTSLNGKLCMASDGRRRPRLVFRDDLAHRLMPPQRRQLIDGLLDASTGSPIIYLHARIISQILIFVVTFLILITLALVKILVQRELLGLAPLEGRRCLLLRWAQSRS